MQISLKEWFSKNKDNPTKITQLVTQITELKQLVLQMNDTIQEMQKEIKILKEGDNI